MKLTKTAFTEKRGGTLLERFVFKFYPWANITASKFSQGTLSVA